MNTPATLLCTREVCARLGISRTQLHRLRNAGAFPQPLKVSQRSVRFRTDDIETWLAARPRAGSDRETQP
jgi:predicted DNA-binding transcriptional regulator AlpA